MIGQVADGGREEAEVALAAARRAFDETDWATNPALRKRCLTQLREGFEKEKEALREQTVAEVGSPIQLTYGPQGDSVIADQSCSGTPNDDDAVRIANDSIYGLSGAIASASEDRALSVARRIRTGTIGVNGGMWFGADAPFGGYKQSLVGREMGEEGFAEYLETKTVGLPA